MGDKVNHESTDGALPRRGVPWLLLGSCEAADLEQLHGARGSREVDGGGKHVGAGLDDSGARRISREEQNVARRRRRFLRTADCGMGSCRETTVRAPLINAR